MCEKSAADFTGMRRFVREMMQSRGFILIAGFCIFVEDALSLALTPTPLPEGEGLSPMQFWDKCPTLLLVRASARILFCASSESAVFKPLSLWDWNSSREVRERGWGEGVTGASSKAEPDKSAAEASSKTEPDKNAAKASSKAESDKGEIKAAAPQSIPRSFPIQFFQFAQDGFQY